MASARSAPAATFRPDINGLRAIAVLAVVLFHFSVAGFDGGFVGVDVFFVISGFLMTRIIVTGLREDRFSVLDFYLARARRILPALAVLCLAMLVLGLVSLAPHTYAPTGLHLASAVTFLSNFVFWNESGYFDVASSNKWLLHTWSLSVEWQFYLLYPLLLMAAGKWLRTGTRFALAVCGAFLVSLAISVLWTRENPDAAYFLLPARAWEMLAGGIAFLVTPYVRLPPVGRHALELTGLGLIALATLGFDSGNPWPGHLALIPVAGAVMMILAQNTESTITVNPAARFIGESSYSIYLWHWPVVVALGKRELLGDWHWVVAGLVITLALGYASYRWVEVPTRARRSVRTRFAESMTLSAAAAALCVGGLVVFFRNGLPERLGSDQDAYLAAQSSRGDWLHPGSNCARGKSLRVCERQGPGEDLVMFIGDSIAEQWYPRYGRPGADYAEDTLFVTRPGCPPVRNLDGYPPGNHCGENARAMWDLVRERQPDQLVISSAWWTTFFFPDGAFRGRACVSSDAGCEQITTVAVLREAFAPFEADVREAVNRGVEVLIIGPVPSAQVDYADARMVALANKHLLLPVTRNWQSMPGFPGGRQTIGIGMASLADRSVEMPAYGFDSRDNSPASVMLRLLDGIAGRTGASLIAPDAYLCPDRICPLTGVANMPIYRDALHLRAQYVKSDALAWLDAAIGFVDATP